MMSSLRQRVTRNLVSETPPDDITHKKEINKDELITIISELTSWFFKNVGLLPSVFFAEVLFFALGAKSVASSGLISSAARNSIYVACVALTFQFVVVNLLAKRGLIEKYIKLSWLPGLWLPIALPNLTVATAVSFLRNSPSPQAETFSAFVEVVRNYPQSHLIGIQCIRILAALSIIKARRGLFPLVVAKFLAVPDLIFGLSAWIMLALSVLGGITFSPIGFATWNIFGVLAVVPVGVLSISAEAMGWSPRQHPPSEIMLRLPMVWGPTTVVPILLFTNAISAAVTLDVL